MASISAALERLWLQFSIKVCQLSTDMTLCASSLQYTETDHTAKSLINPSEHKQTMEMLGQYTRSLFYALIVDFNTMAHAAWLCYTVQSY